MKLLKRRVNVYKRNINNYKMQIRKGDIKTKQ